MDIRVSKAFDFGRPGNLELLFEVFNLFNYTNSRDEQQLRSTRRTSAS